MANSVFRKESLDKVSSPEQLNDYIKVSGLSVWIIIGAAIVLLVSGIVWSAAASLQTTVAVNGIVKDGVFLCYLEDASSLKKDTEVNFPDGSVGTITSVSAYPLSKKEVAQKYGEYETYLLKLSEWNYEASFSAEGVADGPCTAEIVVDSVKPVSFFWK